MSEPRLEKIEPVEESSFFMIHQKEPNVSNFDFWHFHPEYEIVYLPDGKGRRFIEGKVSHFDNGDLVLLGPNIPHNTFYFGFESKDYEEYVIQFKGDKILELAKNYREFGRITNLLMEARTGLCIAKSTKHNIGSLIRGMTALKPFERLLELFKVLGAIENSKHKRNLNVGEFVSIPPVDSERIRQVFRIIQNDYQDTLYTKKVADQLSMTESSFCRFFLKSTGKTFKSALNDFRVQRAASLLVNSNLKVNVIAVQCGFNSVPLFYRFFRNFSGTTPADYRNRNSKKIRVS